MITKIIHFINFLLKLIINKKTKNLKYQINFYFFQKIHSKY